VLARPLPHCPLLGAPAPRGAEPLRPPTGTPRREGALAPGADLQVILRPPPKIFGLLRTHPDAMWTHRGRQKASKSALVDAVDAVHLKNGHQDQVYREKVDANCVLCVQPLIFLRYLLKAASRMSSCCVRLIRESRRLEPHSLKTTETPRVFVVDPFARSRCAEAL
jgi:hypothetical protein